MFEWLKRLLGISNDEDIVIRDGIKIPAAFTPLKIGMIKNPDKKPANLRYYNDEPFVFDENNKEYQTFYAQCLEDTRKLRKALSVKLEQQSTFFRGAQKPLTQAQKEKYYKVNIIIRPPLMTSKTGSEGLEDGLFFALHFDEFHNFIFSRFLWQGGSDICSFKNKTAGTLVTKKEELSQAYGDWNRMAEIIIVCLKNNEWRLAEKK